MKKNLKKFLLSTVAVLLVMALSVGGTLAYLQSESETKTNIFNANKVKVELTEEGTQSYNIIPGTSEEKKATVTVDNSIPAYVYVQITDTTKGLVTWAPADGWKPLDGTTDVFWRAVGKDGEKTFSVLAGDKVSYAASLTNDDMKKVEGTIPKLTFKAFAIQQQPFANAVEAWTQLPTQVATVEELQNALDNAYPGKPIQLTAPVSASEPLVVTKPGTVLDLNGQTIAPAEGTAIWDNANNWSLLSVSGPDAELTINGNGKFAATPDDSYAVDVRGGAKLTINGGEYVGNVHAVYVEKGELTVNGGKYSVQQKFPTAGKENEFVLNCLDANYKNGTAKILVTGGSFYEFDPTNCQAEGASTNFTPYGYTADKGEDGYYTVVPKVMNNSGKINSALTWAKDGDTILVTEDMALKQNLLFQPKSAKSVTLDLNGHKLTKAAGWLAFAGTTEGTEITIKNGELETSANGIVAQKGVKVTLENVKLTVDDYAVYATDGNAEVVLKNCEITTTTDNPDGGFAVLLYGNDNNVTIEDTVINADCGIYQSGNFAPTTFNLRNTTINSGSLGIYISNQAGKPKQTLNIENSTIKGLTAVEVKHTNVTIVDSDLIATTTEKTAVEEGSGSCTTGYGLAVTSNSKNESATGTVTVTGGNVGDVFVFGNDASVQVDGTEIPGSPEYYTPKTN